MPWSPNRKRYDVYYVKLRIRFDAVLNRARRYTSQLGHRLRTGLCSC